MKILLTVPMNRPSSASVAINDNGLGFCAAAFKDAGADVTLYSWNVNMSLNEFQENILKLKPNIVGIKTFTMNFNYVFATLQTVRKALPKAMTIIGGPHPSTSKPENIFIEFGNLIDYAIAGDGEIGIIELTKIISKSNGKPSANLLSKVPGLIYMNGNKVISNPKSVDVDLENLPKIDWELQNPTLFNRNLTAGLYKTNKKTKKSDIGNHLPPAFFQDSRGCHGRCGHCTSWLINGNNIRKRKLESLIKELDILINKHGARVLEFTGNELFYDKNYIRKLCEWFINLNVPVKWGCTGGPNISNLNDPELMEMMHKAGCTIIHFGIESGSPSVRRREKKIGTLKEITEIIKLAISKNISVASGFMFGFTDETLREMNETLKYSMAIPFTDVSYVIYLPLPGTLAYKGVLKKYGIERIDWSTYNFKFPKLLPTKAPLWQVYFMFYMTKILIKFQLAAKIYRWFFRIKVLKN